MSKRKLPDCIKWYVWNPLNGPPTIAHECEQSAVAEADRLAGINAGQAFLVLACVGFSLKEPATLFRRLDEIPF